MADNIVHIQSYRYNEKECLGKGSFGEVYKGHHDQNKTLVLAIKRIQKGKLAQKIVDQEIQILQELSRPEVQHDHFVTLVDCVQTDEHVYLVMEYCNGGDLDHYLKAKKKFSERRMKIFLQQIASGLKILHDREIVHRDLKPANILLTIRNGLTDGSNTTFKIADFGLGRFLDEGAQAQTFCGTPVYMAPEIFVPNAKYDYKADLFSIGAIAYQCYAGTLFSPFEGKPPKLPASTSRILADLIERLLRRDPNDRINSNDFYNHPFLGMTGAAQNPAQKNIPQYAAEVNPRRALTPAAKGAAQNPAQKNIPQYAAEVNPGRALTPAAKEVPSTQLMKTLVLENRDVYGVAHLHSMFYILTRSPNAIVYYSDQSPFLKVKDFDITEHIKHPQDIASNEASTCLYVTDIGNNCIWKVEHAYTFKLARWASDVSSPHTLSVGPEGRVVTFGNQSKNLDVYRSDAVLLHHVPLPSEVKAPQHAVETSKGNYVVSYGELNGKDQGIFEINTTGKVLRRYEHKTEKLNHPTHLAVDSDDKVYVVDNAHSRILQLDSLLKLEQVLPSDERNKLDKPFRLFLKSIKGQRRLLVEHRINAVDIYSLS